MEIRSKIPKRTTTQNRRYWFLHSLDAFGKGCVMMRWNFRSMMRNINEVIDDMQN